MTWHETAARWGATSAAILAIGALGGKLIGRLWVWVGQPWYSHAFLDRMAQLSKEIGVLSEAIADLRRELVTSDGLPLRTAIEEADKRITQMADDIASTNRRIDACLLPPRRHKPDPERTQT